MSNKQRKLKLWQDLTNDYTALAKRADKERAERTAADLFIREIEDYLKTIRTALEAGDLQAMEAAHDDACGMFGHIIHPELFAGPATKPQELRRLAANLACYSDQLLQTAGWYTARVRKLRTALLVASRTRQQAEDVLRTVNETLDSGDLERLRAANDLAALFYHVEAVSDQEIEDFQNDPAKQRDEESNPFNGAAPDWLAEDDLPY